jgi:tetratricopeptide (TPR) repeat protein
MKYLSGGLLLTVFCLPGCGKPAGPEKAASDLRLKAGEALGKNDFETAIKFASEALELDPHNIDALWMRGLARLKVKDYARAEADLNQAIKLDPKYGPAYRERASVFLAQEKYAAAVEDASTFLRMRPNDADGLRIRILAYTKIGNHAAANADLREYDKVKGKK